MICKRRNSQTVRNVVDKIKGTSVASILKSKTTFSKWGKCEILKEDDKVVIYKLLVNRAQKTDMFEHRKHVSLTILDDTAKIHFFDDDKILHKGECASINQGVGFCIENISEKNINIILTVIK